MKKLFVILASIIFIVLACTACGNKSDPSPTPNSGFQLENASADIALILGTHGNRYHIANYLDPHVENISKVVQYGGSVTLIVNDQAPSPVTIHYQKIDTSMPRYQQDQEKSEKVKELITKAVTAKADDPETDMHKCLAAAASALRQGSAAQKVIIILDSAVASTAGEISLTTLPVLDDIKTETIIDHMLTQGTFARSYVDLSDCTVLWSSFACTSAPQDDLTAKAVDTLRSFWEGVLYRLGAKFVDISPDFGGQKAYGDELPAVTPISIPAVDDLDISHIDKLILRETLLFVPDSTDFLHPAEASKTLDRIGSILNANHQSILIAGSIATVESSDRGASFSKERADRVKEELVSRGVSSSRLTTIGLGCFSPDHVNDLSPDGSLDESKAVDNRNITLCDVDSEDAQRLLQAVQE